MQKNLGYVIPSIVIPDAATNIGYWYLGSVPLGVRATGTMWTIGADHYWYVDNTKTEYLAEIPVEEYNQQWQELIEDCTEQWDTYYNNKTAEINLWFNTEGAQFTQWFNRIKNQLSSDAAGHLQLEIDSLVQSFSEHIEDYDISSDDYVVGDILMYKNRLCKVVAAITAGDTFITDDSDPNQNIEYGTIFEMAQGTPGVFYNTDADAEADIANIPEGSMVYTNDDESLQDVIDGMTSLHLAGSQVGTGTTNFTFNTEAQKRMLCIAKKSGVIVESKEIPVDVLESGDTILVGRKAPVIGTNNIPNDATLSSNLVNRKLFQKVYTNPISGTNYLNGSLRAINNGTEIQPNTGTSIGLATDLSASEGASITYNGNNSFTITVTDSTLSVYVYVDMLVLGGSASARNVSFDGAGTDLVSTDVEGVILELLEKIGGLGMPTLDYTNYLHIFTSSAPSDIPSGATYGLSFIANKDCYLHGVYLPYNNKLTINGKEMCPYTASSGFVPLTWKLSASDVVTVQGAVSSLYVLSEK